MVISVLKASVEHIAVASQRAAKKDQPFGDQSVHRPGVLIPALLLAQVARPIQWAVADESHRVLLVDDHVGVDMV